MEDDNIYQVSLTPKAAEQIRQQLQKRGSPNSYLRLGIKGSGCSGFSYHLQFEDSSPRDRDRIFHSNGVDIVIDIKSLIYLNGCTLDWEQSLIKQGFKFINPNEKSTCGCGMSFTT